MKGNLGFASQLLDTLKKHNKKHGKNYLSLMEKKQERRYIFIHLNIRNSIMHGSGEPFDDLHIGIAAIILQLLWDIAKCAIFKEE